MKSCIYSSLLLLTLNAVAGQVFNGIQVIKDSHQNVILKTSCNRIAQVTSNLRNLGPIRKNGNYCEVSLNASLPPEMLLLHDTFARHTGPNCWNTSLYMAGVLSFRRTVEAEEMDFLTSYPICRQLRKNEPPQLGDLIAIHSRGTPAEFHGFTYLNDWISFSKHGFDKQFGYEIVSSEYVFTLFALGPGAPSKPWCRKVYGIPNENECPVYAQYFRCQTHSQYLRRSAFPSKREFLEFDRDTSLLERMISESTVSGAPWSREKSKALKSQIAEATRIGESFAERATDHSSVEYFFWNSTLLKLHSLLVQIEYLDAND